MGHFFWLISMGAAVSAIGVIIWWFIVFFVIITTVDSARQKLNRLLPGIEALLRQASGSPARRLKSHQQAQLSGMLIEARRQMRHLNAVHRQRYENRVDDLMGMAAQAGIDFSPGGF